MPRPTVHDVASEAGVSLATVDRVLNGRAGVREKTAKRVHAAIDRLGFVRDTSAANLARQRQYKFVAVLPDDQSQFTDTIRIALKEAASAQFTERTTLKIVTVAPDDPHAITRKLLQLRRSKPDGVAIMAQETPQVRDAIARLKGDGIAVAALLSDLPSSERDFYVGINSQSAGRTAAFLLGRFLGKETGKVLVVTGSLMARDSIDRRLGFDTVMLDEFPALRALPTIELRNDPTRSHAVIQRIMAQHDDIIGVYSMGSGNRHLVTALKATGKMPDLVYVAHELTPYTRQGLIAGEIDAVIAQNVGHLARSTLRVLRAKCDNVAIFEAQERIRIDILTRENLPA